MHHLLDFCFQAHPELVKDQFWEDLYPELPYTAAVEEEMAKNNDDIVMGNTANVEVSEAMQEFVNLNSVVDDKSHMSYSKDSSNIINLRRGTLFQDVTMFRNGGVIPEGNEDDEEDEENETKPVDATTKLLATSQKSGLNLNLQSEMGVGDSGLAAPKNRTLSMCSTFSGKSKKSNKSSTENLKLN